jgi:hypothetical protein
VDDQLEQGFGWVGWSFVERRRDHGRAVDEDPRLDFAAPARVSYDYGDPYPYPYPYQYPYPYPLPCARAVSGAGRINGGAVRPLGSPPDEWVRRSQRRHEVVAPAALLHRRAQLSQRLLALAGAPGRPRTRCEDPR